MFRLARDIAAISQLASGRLKDTPEDVQTSHIALKCLLIKN
jgi:hypothetical protein